MTKRQLKRYIRKQVAVLQQIFPKFVGKDHLKLVVLTPEECIPRMEGQAYIFLGGGAGFQRMDGEVTFGQLRLVRELFGPSSDVRVRRCDAQSQLEIAITNIYPPV